MTLFALFRFLFSFGFLTQTGLVVGQGIVVFNPMRMLTQAPRPTPRCRDTYFWKQPLKIQPSALWYSLPVARNRLGSFFSLKSMLFFWELCPKTEFWVLPIPKIGGIDQNKKH